LAKDTKIGASLISARGDMVATKPSFRAAFTRRSCLVLADGFYEWQKGTKPKQPYHIRMKDSRPFAFAGLWDRWKGEEPVESCKIITTDANDVLRPLAGPAPVDPAMLQEMLRPYAADAMTAVPANVYVNNSRNEGPECLAAGATA